MVVLVIYLLLSLLANTKASPNGTTFHNKPAAIEVWCIGLGSVTFISLCSCVGIALMVLMNQSLYERCLTCFVALGVGSLCGSAIFHLIPEAFELGHGSLGHSEQHEDHHHMNHHGDNISNSQHEAQHINNNEQHQHGESTVYLQMCWFIIAGIFLFFIVDKLLKLFFAYRKIKRVSTNSSSLSTENKPADPGMTMSDSSIFFINLCEGKSKDATGVAAVHPADTGDAVQAQTWCEHDHISFKKGDSVIKTVAWMIIFGDGLHNFVDGLSIGAAFAVSIVSGVSVSIAILCEELPHELGDVAILVNAGMSLKQALLFNLLSAGTCYIGFIVGVVLGDLEVAVYIFAFAGGMFLYISLACMMPEMNGLIEKKLKTAASVGPAAKLMVLHTVGVGMGLLIMFLLSRYHLEKHF